MTGYELIKARNPNHLALSQESVSNKLDIRD